METINKLITWAKQPHLYLVIILILNGLILWRMNEYGKSLMQNYNAGEIK